MDRVVKVAVIGAGSMANRVHYPSLASLGDVEISAICDLDADRLNATADKYGVTKRYADYRKMVEGTAPEAVYVIGPPHMMYDIWMWCLEEGINLYIEKPLGITIHQAQCLAHVAERAGCITQVSFQRRSAPIFSALKAECLKRGKIYHAVCQFYKWHQHPRFLAWDHITGDAIHAIDTLRWICGGEVVGIHSVAKRVGKPNINYYSAIIESDNGATGVLSNSWCSGRRTFRVEMHAPAVCAEAEHEGIGYLYSDGNTEGIEYDSRQVAGSDEFFVYGGFQAKHREFVDCLKAGKQPGSNFADALKTMEVSERILGQALQAGVWQ